MADIRSFFGAKNRKRKTTGTPDEEDRQPARKRRKLAPNASEDAPKDKTAENQENTNTANSTDTTTTTSSSSSSSSACNQDGIPSIASLDIEQQSSEHKQEAKGERKDENEDADYVPNDDEDAIEDDDDEDDDVGELPTNSASSGGAKSRMAQPTPSKPTADKKEATILSKQKEESLRESLKYEVVASAGFTAAKLVEYSVMSGMFEQLTATTKRLEKTELMSRLFRSILRLKGKDAKTLLYAVYLCCNEIAPPFEGLELGIGDSIILKALCESTGRKLRELKAEVQEAGDLGDVAVKCRSKQNTLFKPKPLTMVDVFETFKKIAQTTGTGTQQHKVRSIQRLFVAAKASEARYLCRHLQGKLRIGVNEQTVLAALGRALALHELGIFSAQAKRRKLHKIAELEKAYTGKLKMAVSQLPSYERVIGALIAHGIGELAERCVLTPGIPIKVMLAKPTKGIAEILRRFEGVRFTLEYKYDGERAQIHLLADGTVKIFSRNAEDNTAKFPELPAAVRKFARAGVESFIVDSEVVAFDRAADSILPFSTLMRRKRKNVRAEDVTVSVCIYAFDLLLLNGEPLIEKTFAQRRRALHAAFEPVRGEFCFAHHKDTDEPEEIAEYLSQAVGVGKCEGLMVKTLDVDATYEPSRRSHNWLKCKKDYLEGVGDTLDLVVMGAFHGTGKRTGTFGSYLVGVYSEHDDAYQSCCKVATGFSDEDLQRLTSEMTPHIAAKKPADYEAGYECEVWFEPKAVWELKCADLTISPTHQAAAGLAHEVKGIALRFPRFLNRRADKQPMDATSAQQIAEMYSNQAMLN